MSYKFNMKKINLNSIKDFIRVNKGKIITLAICIIVFCIFAFGCTQSLYGMAESNISEYRKNLFIGSDDNIVASLTSGQREDNYLYDGKPGKLVDFGMLTVKYTGTTPEYLPSYTLTIDGQEYTGTMQFNTINGTFAADIGKQIKDNADVYLRLHSDLGDEQLSMPCVSCNFKIDYNSAFKIAVDQMKDVINSKIDDSGILNGEFFIKIIGDRQVDVNNIYWYVLFVGTDGTSNACVIDTQSGAVISSK